MSQGTLNVAFAHLGGRERLGRQHRLLMSWRATLCLRLLRHGSLNGLPKHERVIDFPAHTPLELVHDVLELVLMVTRHVALLEDAHVTLHVKDRFVWCDFRPMDHRHAWLLFQIMQNLLFFVRARADSLGRPVHHVLVYAAHVKARVFAEAARFRL